MQTPVPTRTRQPWRAALPMLALAGITMALGYWLKARCLDQPWVGGYEFRHFCYTDIQALYSVNGYADGKTPYVDAQSEYPVLTGITAWVIARMTDGVSGFWHLNALLLMTAGFGVTWLLFRFGHDWKSAAPWCLAPSLLLDSFTNWDLWAVFFMVAALYAFHHEQWLISGVMVGLGTAAKIFPAILGVAFVLVTINRARIAQARVTDRATVNTLARLAGGFTLGWLPLNLVFILINRELWWATYRFHADRGTSFQTIYYYWDQFVSIPILHHPMTSGEFSAAASVLFFLGLSVIALVALRQRTADVMILTIALVTMHILTNKFYSPQYTLWLLPLFVLARIPTPLFWTFSAAHVAAYVWGYHFRMPPAGETQGPSMEFVPPFTFASVILTTTMVVLFGIAIRRMLTTPAGTSPEEAQAPGPASGPDPGLPGDGPTSTFR